MSLFSSFVLRKVSTVPEIRSQKTCVIAEGRQLSPEEWNKQLGTDLGDIIHEALRTFYDTPLFISDHHTQACLSYSVAARKFGLPTHTSIVRHNKLAPLPIQRRDHCVNFCDLVSQTFGKSLVEELGEERKSRLIALLNDSFEQGLRQQLARLFSHTGVERIEHLLHASLRISIYYFIGFLLLGKKEEQKLMKAIMDMFAAGNYPFLKTQTGELIIIVQ